MIDLNDETIYGSVPSKPNTSHLKPDKDGIIEYVNKDMLIGDIIAWYPDTAMVLIRCGMYCITCPASQMETLEQACAVHGLEPDDVAKVVNDFLTQTLQSDPEAESASSDEGQAGAEPAESEVAETALEAEPVDDGRTPEMSDAGHVDVSRVKNL